jgi:hypothetical protein
MLNVFNFLLVKLFIFMQSYGNEHPFYWIPPSDIIKLQLATPSVSNKLARYPEKTDRFIKELYQVRLIQTFSCLL